MGGMRRLHIRISGDVQGVFFRAGAQSEALRLGLRGFVRNLPDGSVEVVAEGEEGALKRMLAWCMRGPKGASVSDVESEMLEASGEFSGFRIVYG